MRASVIIPCHNAARYIAAALDSIAAQTLPAHETIVINDSSTDDSVAIVEGHDLPVTLLHCEHRNAAATRNEGIAAATGDWIAFLDADDLWMPHHLQRAGDLLDGGEDVAFIANHNFLYEDGEVVEIPESLRPKLDEPETAIPAARWPELLTQGFHFGHSTVLLRRDRVEEVGWFDVTQTRRPDMALWLKMSAGRTWAYDTQLHATYRADTPGSISRNEPECEYYFLKALLRHRAAFAGPAMDALIAQSARRAMSLNFVDATWAEYQRARDLAIAHVPAKFAWGYRLGALCPPVMRAMIRRKRRRLWARVAAE